MVFAKSPASQKVITMFSTRGWAMMKTSITSMIPGCLLMRKCLTSCKAPASTSADSDSDIKTVLVAYNRSSSVFFTRSTVPKAPRPIRRTNSYRSCDLRTGGVESIEPVNAHSDRRAVDGIVTAIFVEPIFGLDITGESRAFLFPPRLRARDASLLPSVSVRPNSTSISTWSGVSILISLLRSPLRIFPMFCLPFAISSSSSLRLFSKLCRSLAYESSFPRSFKAFDILNIEFLN
mmetsp:Transcript_23514/g.23722  ORF Transcript_23514/g.23722 Transcript_23514/m.23722 type:complete len:235 (-) Transcript_23514:207-911(-)